eukprot:7090815-Alexandrium_andersonii.AAC.1
MLCPPGLLVEDVAARHAPLQNVPGPSIRSRVPSTQHLETTPVAMVDAKLFRSARGTDRARDREVMLRLEGVDAVRQPRRGT